MELKYRRHSEKQYSAAARLPCEPADWLALVARARRISAGDPSSASRKPRPWVPAFSTCGGGGGGGWGREQEAAGAAKLEGFQDWG